MTIYNPASKILNFDLIEKQLLINPMITKIYYRHSILDSLFNKECRSLVISLKNLEEFGSIFIVEPFFETKNKCCYIFWETTRITHPRLDVIHPNYYYNFYPDSIKNSYKMFLNTSETFDMGISMKEQDISFDLLLTLGVPKDAVYDLKLKLLLSINETLSRVIFEVKQSLRSNSEDFIIGVNP